MASSRPRAALPRILAAFERPPRSGFPAALLKALRGAAQVELLVSRPAGLRSAAKRAASKGAYRALVMCDGPSARTALSGFWGMGAPAVLAIDGAAAPAAAAVERSRRAGPSVHGAPFPAEIWQFGRAELVNAPSEFLPGIFRTAPRPSAAWISKRLRSVRERAPTPVTHALATIVVPCWNQLAMTKQCLRHVKQWTSDPYEVLVIDNGSSDGTARYVRALNDKRFRVIRNEKNLGFARAINQGIEAARGRYVVWLNNDCWVTPSWLDRMIAAVERAPWIGMVGPYTNETSGVQRLSQSYDVKRFQHFAEARALSRAGRAVWTHRLTGFCLLQRAEVARAIGGLDERFGLGCYEDLDYCLRARQAGYEMFVAEDVFVHHHGHATFNGGDVSFKGQVRVNREVFIDKWCRKSLEFLDELDGHFARGYLSGKL